MTNTEYILYKDTKILLAVKYLYMVNRGPRL
jgi:hypothetical protein